ncbi:MAG TPA: glycoside hydrolase family 3 N-terminal domain-containing protein [Thermoleophilaceae bacterium]|nr:glycoside hydrolase family 3 N-terminal domain-containing protein [Thermoleophilaceae bacterium]
MGHEAAREGHPLRRREDPGDRPVASSVRRRRLAALGAVAALALAVGLVAGAGEDEPASKDAGSTAAPSRQAPSEAARLPLERRLGELLVMSFDGPTAPDYIVRRLRSGEGTGVILFAKNAPDARALRALTAGVQRAAGGAALVATDQEGGDIRTLPFAPPESSQGRLGSPEAVTAAARDAARGLRAGGVNVNLAPVADVADSLGSVVAGRAFPGDGRAVAELTAASARAHGRERVGATAKHFPGLGRATENTDDTSVTIPASRAELEGTDLVPFVAAVRAGAPLVMSSHALYPALDRRRIASQSPAILRDLLRGRLDFRGAVVTDSIEAQAVLDRSGVGAAAERSVEAGNDLILMTGSGSFNQVQPRLLARARRDPRFRARVTEAAGRVLALKRRLGLRAPP